MAINFHLKYHSNLYFLVDNMSRCFFFSRHESLQFYEKMFKLTPDEKLALETYKQIRSKYGNKKINTIMSVSENMEDAKINCYKQMEKNDVDKLFEVFELFKPNFDKVWHSEIYKKIKQKTSILKKFVKTKKFISIKKDLLHFFSSKFNDNFDVHIFFSGLNSGGGDANFTNNDISIELNPSSSIKSVEGTIIHEYAHIVDRYGIKVDSHIPKKVSLADLHEPIVYNISNLLSQKYLGSKEDFKENYYTRFKNYLNLSNVENQSFLIKNYRYAMINLLNYKMYNITKEYFEKNKKIDDHYIKKMIEMSRTVLRDPAFEKQKIKNYLKLRTKSGYQKITKRPIHK